MGSSKERGQSPRPLKYAVAKTSKRQQKGKVHPHKPNSMLNIVRIDLCRRVINKFVL